MSSFRFPLIALLAACLLACSRSQNETAVVGTYALQLVDSVRVDYMGSMELKDYDPETGHYLAYNQQKKEVLIFDFSGTIVHSFTLKDDGPDAINGYGLNPTFAADNILILADKIFTLDLEGKVLNRTEIPYPYYWIVGGGHIAAFNLTDKLLYYKPESAEDGRDGQAAYQRMLDGGPMLEVLDTISGEYIPTMHFPETDAFEPGLFYGYPTPYIGNRDARWFLSVNNALEFHVYAEEEQQLYYQQTVRIPARDAYLDQPVPLEQMHDFFQKNGMVYQIPQISRFLPMEDLFIVFYSKGVSPEMKAAYDVSIPEERLELVHSFPMEFAVFDQDFNNLAVDLPIPKTMVPFTALVDKGEHIVGLKDQEYAGVEEDFHTLYKFKLVSSEE